MSPRILLVDDDPAVLALVASRLSRAESFRVSVALGGAEGARQAARLVPDLVVCDLQMPEVGGRELLARLRNDGATAAIPVVFLSSLDAGEDEATIDGCPVVSKGAPAGRLEARIRALLPRAGSASPSP